MREKERELLYVGEQYRKAIELYYAQGKQYPRELTQLLRDQRVPGVRRYLRKLYRDPMTAKGEWGLIKTPDGGIAGVYSLSEETPFKQANFKKSEATFTGKAKYSDWKFAYFPQSAPGTSPPGAPGTASAQGTPGAATQGQATTSGTASPQAGGGTASSGSPSTQGAAPSGGSSFGTPSGGSSFGTPSGGSAFGTPGGGTQSGGSSQAAPSSSGGGLQPAAPRQ
jgi:hypothetical protein